VDANQIIQETDGKMKKAIEATKREFSSVRTGRASTSLVENIKVEYYGSLVPLNQVAGISIPDSRTIEMKPWDIQALQEIEKAILKSDLGLNPNNDGKVIRVNIPPLTEERRKDFVKMVHKHAEDGRVAIRSIRQDANKKFQERVQKMTDTYTQEINTLREHKEKEILEI
jgi:ribosome recycling factor